MHFLHASCINLKFSVKLLNPSRLCLVTAHHRSKKKKKMPSIYLNQINSFFYFCFKKIVFPRIHLDTHVRGCKLNSYHSNWLLFIWLAIILKNIFVLSELCHFHRIFFDIFLTSLFSGTFLKVCKLAWCRILFGCKPSKLASR